ncbi:MAG: cation transporter [Planctomycetes bacterium]|nr:cation transporter [Planctomycetota bacterium]
MPHVHNHECHGHQHAPPASFQRAFALGVALNTGFVVIEAATGIWSHSTALIADAGHNLSDVLGLLIAWGAARLGAVGPNERHTYGLKRTSILAALLNALVLLLVTGGIGWEAIGRLAEPVPVTGTTMMVVAAIGVLINGATALLFMSGRHHDVNIRGAFLHMAADAAVSVGVVVSGALVTWLGWVWVDAVTSLVIVAVILASTSSLFWESINLALDAVPKNIDAAAVRDYLRQLPGITDVHDLHIWGISTTETALTVHLVKPDGIIDDAILDEIEGTLRSRFHILHPTVQLERGRMPHVCALRH